MTAEQQLAWLRENTVLVFHSRHKFMLWHTPHPFVEAKTLEEAIGLMMAQMGMVESTIGGARESLLLGDIKHE